MCVWEGVYVRERSIQCLAFIVCVCVREIETVCVCVCVCVCERERRYNSLVNIMGASNLKLITFIEERDTFKRVRGRERRRKLTGPG